MARLVVTVVLAVLILGAFAGAVVAADSDASQQSSGIPIMVNVTPSPLEVYSGPGSGQDQVSEVAAVSGTVAYAVGYASVSNRDICVRRVGAGAWFRYYDVAAGSFDTGTDIVVSKGYVYATGYAQTTSGDRLVVLKYSPKGKRLWAKTLRAPADGDRSGRLIAAAPDGGVVVAGRANPDGGIAHVLLVKYSPAGKRLWTRIYSPGWNGEANDLLVDGTGSIYVAGRFTQSDGAQSDALVLKATPGGRIAWARRFDLLGAWDSFGALVARPGGGVYAAGTSEIAADDTDGIIFRYTAKGAGKMIVRSGPADHHYTDFADLVKTTDGRLVACGSYADSEFVDSAYLVSSYSQKGVEGWSRTWPAAAGNSRAELLGTRADGGVVVSGYWGDVSEVYHAMTYFVDKNGTRRARCDWAGPSPGMTWPQGLAARGKAVWLVGRCDQLATGQDGFTMRLVRP